MQYEIGLSIIQGRDWIEIELDHSYVCLTDTQATRVLSLLQSTAIALTREPFVHGATSSIATLNLVSKEDMEDIWTWNTSVPEPVRECVHALIEETALRQPEAPAICAWDGDWTYGELNSLSSRLAHRLIKIGVGADTIIPFCFEKSKWVPVAVLAVLKAGGACLTLDTSQPEERLRSMVHQVSPVLILCSPNKQKLASNLTPLTPVIVVDENSTTSLVLPEPTQALPKVDPSNMLYINFTSGSTGLPKGVVITHSNYSSAIKYQQTAHGFKSTSRVYDFASYAFDVSWSNILHTLTCGGCLCIPSDEDRKNDLVGSIARLKVTHADLTPSVARILPTATIHRLQTMVLGGEKLTAKDAKRWSVLVDVKNPYGPSECTPTATITNVRPDDAFDGSIGKGIGLNTWVVDANTENSLVPIGCVGELLLEGPLVGNGYLMDTEKTAAAFIQDPPWLLMGNANQPGRSGRLYKTGDLVRYAPDGNLIFVGRKDAQVKINGQRVELGDIESHVQLSLMEVVSGVHVVADVLSPLSPLRNANPRLAVFLSQRSPVSPEQSGHFSFSPRTPISSDAGRLFGLSPLGPASSSQTSFSSYSPRSPISPNSKLRAFTARATLGLEERLAAKLPAHMIPSSYVVLPRFPVTATGKTDRRRLHEIRKTVPWQHLSGGTSSQQDRRAPTTPLEKQLQGLWASVLGMEAGRIAAGDSFMHLGGDSIAAMKLVGAARDQGQSLSVAVILKQPKLSDMALHLQPLENQGTAPLPIYEPFSLLPSDWSKDKIFRRLNELSISKEDIADVLPITDQQARCIALTHTAARGMLLYHTIDGNGTPDIPRMRTACAELLARFDLLRTIFVAHKNAFLQVVLKKMELGIPVFTTEDASLAEYTERLRQQDMKSKLPFGAYLTSFAIIHQTREQSYRVVARMSHAQHDGMSLIHMWNAFEEVYNGKPDAPSTHGIPLRIEEALQPSTSTANFSNYMFALSCADTQSAMQYWRNLLIGSSITTLKPRVTHDVSYGDGPFVVKEIPRTALLSSDFTYSTVLKAAWAYVLARNCASDDIVFSSLTHGRSLPGTQDVFGDCVNVIPTRVKFVRGWRARDLVDAVNAQQIASLQFEHLGSRQIARECANWPKWSYAGSVVYHHNFDNGEYDIHERGTHVGDLDLSHGDVDHVDVHVTSQATEDHMRLELSFAANVISDPGAHQLATELCETITLFYKSMDMILRSPQELCDVPALFPQLRSDGLETAKIWPTGEQLARAERCPEPAKIALETAWSDVLNRAFTPENRESDSFFDLGGDLVCASLLSAHIERQGYNLSVEDILENPTFVLQLVLLCK
jgi:amino acid adenylation domain-containing protein